MTNRTLNPVAALRHHWPEYLCEAALLGLFMIATCLFGIMFFHPAAYGTQVIDSTFVRRVLMGVAMALTAVGLVYSPMGQRSGAHMNPAVTLTFWRLGKVRTWDAAFYVVAQFIGGAGGVLLVRAVAGDLVAHPAVNHAATVPGPFGILTAWLGEFAIAFILMLVVLTASNHARWTRLTPLLAGALVMIFITFEAPLSGASMNPARTFAAAYWSQIWTALWIYFTAPPAAMLAASEVYRAAVGPRRVYCAKLNHSNRHRCIFNCEFDRMISEHRTSRQTATSGSSAIARQNGDANGPPQHTWLHRPAARTRTETAPAWSTPRQ